MSSSDGAAAPVTALACGTAPVAAGAGTPMEAAGAGARTEIVFATRRGTEVSTAGGLAEAGAPGCAVDVLVAGRGATGDADVAYRENAAVPSPASSTHSNATPARHSVREPASRPGFFDESGAPRVMAHNRWRGARTGSVRQCLRASRGGPGIRPPLWPCSPSHACITLDAFATVRRRRLGETCRVEHASTIVSSVRSTLGLSPCAHSIRMQT